MGEFYGSKCDIEQVELIGQRFNNGSVTIEIIVKECLSKRSQCELHAAVPKIGDGRNLLDCDLVASHSLNVFEQTMFAWLSQRDCDAFATCSSDATDSVHVGLRG